MQVIALVTGIISNYFLFVDSFVGIEFLIGCIVVIAAWAFLYRLMHAKTF